MVPSLREDREQQLLLEDKEGAVRPLMVRVKQQLLLVPNPHIGPRWC